MHSGTTTVHSSQNVETAQMSISEWMDFKKGGVLYTQWNTIQL